jgi:hypothetical protein
LSHSHESRETPEAAAIAQRITIATPLYRLSVSLLTVEKLSNAASADNGRTHRLAQRHKLF